MSKDVSTEDTKMPDKTTEPSKQVHAESVGTVNSASDNIDKLLSSNSASNSTIVSESATSSSTSKENQMDNSDLLPNGDRKVIVKEGDSIYSIAQKYHVGMQQLRFYNNVNKHTMKIRVGQEIIIPAHFVSIPVGE
ncbi:LysM domain-containing protein [Lactobacillus bombicola]|uniref:LysM domain-containing protein n=1 Tax=Lactobacillus bombicola TaxID=1505723 RepID=A0A1I1TPS6_9LACO|nr:LysM peptidoglycan-binding domain-containing protein [Lactobacillus bombicola]SFD60567.1 LysM domain-containing protein [Lactobacillus bombicola]